MPITCNFTSQQSFKSYISSLLLIFFQYTLSAQTSIINQPVINTYAAVTSFDFCTNSLSVSNGDENLFEIGDTVLIIQMKGATINTSLNNQYGSISDYQNSGLYEVNTIKSINFASINGIQFNYKFSHKYQVANNVQIIHIPQYESVRVQSTLSCLPWDGEKGGILILQAQQNIELEANIFASAYGFKGGNVDDDSQCYSAVGGFQGYACQVPSNCGGFVGEGIGKRQDLNTKGRGRNGNGGGGGNDHNAGGGGGGNGGSGGNGGDNDTNTQFCDGSRGLGGDANNHLLNNRLLMGGAGGAGDSNNNTGSAGGKSGGMIILIAQQLKSNGFQIISNGEHAASAIYDGSGGGGSGGTVFLNVNQLIDPAEVVCNGGNGGNVDDDTNCPGVGGGGSGGAVLLSLNNYPPNLNFTANGGTQGIYTNAICSMVQLGVEAGNVGKHFPNRTLHWSTELHNNSTLYCWNDTLVCGNKPFNLGVDINSNEDYSFSWIHNGNSISNDIESSFIKQDAGLYTYTAEIKWSVFDEECSLHDDMQIEVVSPYIRIIATPDTAVYPGSVVFLNAVTQPFSSLYEYYWTPNSVNPPNDANTNTIVFESTEFCIKVTDTSACSQTECIFVPVKEIPYGNPDAFSPNNDGVNDFFFLIPKPSLKQTSLSIYNRWGEKLYYSSSSLEWDGYYKETLQQEDTYVWYATFKDRQSQEISIQSGYVTLIH